MSALHRRLAALERGQPGASIGVFDSSALSEAEALYLIGIYDRRIAGQVINDAEIAEFHRLDAMIVREGRPPQLDAQTAARTEDEFARTVQMGWRS